MREGALAQSLLPDGREVVIYPLIFGTVRLVVGQPDAPFYEDAW